MLSLVSRGRVVHLAMTGVAEHRRDDIVEVPIRGMPPIPLGPVWCATHENARIRALTAVAGRSGAKPIGPPGPAAVRPGRPASADRLGR